MGSIRIRRILHIVFAVLGLIVIQTFASQLGNFIADLFNYSAIDKDGVFMNITVHHIVQMAVALLIIFVIGKKKNLDFFLKPKVDKIGIIYTSIFSGAILIYVLISYVVGYSFGTITPYEYDLNAINIVGTLGFQMLLSGTSEEILFRALPITVLCSVIYKENKSSKAFVIVIASVLFSFAHINWTIVPFTVSFSWFQLVYAFVLGVAYGITYMKSKSIIYPIIMHGLSNFFMVGIGYIFMAVVN